MLRGALGAIGEGLFELGLDEGSLDGPLRRGYGGDAANAAVMAARMGVPSRLCGRVGEDAIGRLLLAFWRRQGVDTRHVRVDPDAPTGLYVNERCRSGEHRFHYHRRGSAGSRLEPGDVDDEFLAGLGALHVTGITLAVSEGAAAAAREATERARRAAITVSFAVNHRPRLDGDPAELLQQAREAAIVFVSLEEAQTLFGAEDERAIERALRSDATREVVVTAGARGATLFAGGSAHAVPAPPVAPVDTAGAGDALAGAYLAARLRGADPAAALRAGVGAATLSCAAYGCALSYPSGTDVDSTASSLA